jgi:hypothetical protein
MRVLSFRPTLRVPILPIWEHGRLSSRIQAHPRRGSERLCRSGAGAAQRRLDRGSGHEHKSSYTLVSVAAFAGAGSCLGLPWAAQVAALASGSRLVAE